MNKNDVFTFTAPNGVEVTAVVIMQCGYFHEECYGYHIDTTWLCYAQNRLFTYHELHDSTQEWDEETGEGPYSADTVSYEYGGIVVEYCVLPDYDRVLEDYQHHIDMVNDYADKTL